MFSKMIGLVTLPIIARALGPESYGNYNLVNIIIHYTSIPVGLLGLRSYGIREIAANRKEKSYALEIISMQLSMALMATFISLIVCSLLFHSNLLLYLAILIGFIQVFATSLDLEFFYVSQKDLVFPTIARLIGQLIYMVGVILFIHKPNDFPLLVFLASLTPVISTLIQLKRYHFQHNSLTISFGLKEALRTFRTTYKLGISQNLEGFYPSIPQMLLPIILGPYALGIFSGGYKVYSILIMFYVTLFYALAPYLVKMKEYPIKTKQKYHFSMFLVLLFCSVMIGIVLYFWGEKIVVLILGKSFGESIQVFKVISLTLIPMTPVMMLLGNILIYSQREKYYLIALIISAITIFISSPFLIIHFQTIGAVYALTIAMLVGILVLFYYYFRTEGKTKTLQSLV